MSKRKFIQKLFSNSQSKEVESCSSIDNCNNNNSMTRNKSNRGKHNKRQHAGAAQLPSNIETDCVPPSSHRMSPSVKATGYRATSFDAPACDVTDGKLSGSAEPVCRRKNKALQDEFRTLLRRKMCYECDEQDSRILALPCRHLVLCEECQDDVTQCPFCGDDILGTVKVFFG